MFRSFTTQNSVEYTLISFQYTQYQQMLLQATVFCKKLVIWSDSSQALVTKLDLSINLKVILIQKCIFWVIIRCQTTLQIKSINSANLQSPLCLVKCTSFLLAEIKVNRVQGKDGINDKYKSLLRSKRLFDQVIIQQIT